MYQLKRFVNVEACGAVKLDVYREVYRPRYNPHNRAMLADVAQRWVMFDNHPPAWLEVC
jgi:hypothetical protein